MLAESSLENILLLTGVDGHHGESQDHGYCIRKEPSNVSIQTDTTMGCLASCGGDLALQKSILNIPFVFVIEKKTCANATTKLCKIACACIHFASVIRHFTFLQRIVLLIIKHNVVRVILFKNYFY